MALEYRVVNTSRIHMGYFKHSRVLGRLQNGSNYYFPEASLLEPQSVSRT